MTEIQTWINKLKQYTWWERVKYNKKRKWFSKRKFLKFFWVPTTPTNRDIAIDHIWRDLQVKAFKKQNI